MRCRVELNTATQPIRSPTLISWPTGDVAKRLRSEYHYLFWRVAHMLGDVNRTPTVEKQIEAATVLPNVCRRLLEGFLGFKAPADLGNLYRQLDEAGGSVVPKAAKERIRRFLDHYSHFEEANTTKPVERPEAVEMLHVVLEYMK